MQKTNKQFLQLISLLIEAGVEFNFWKRTNDFHLVAVSNDHKLVHICYAADFDNFSIRHIDESIYINFDPTAEDVFNYIKNVFDLKDKEESLEDVENLLDEETISF